MLHHMCIATCLSRWNDGDVTLAPQSIQTNQFYLLFLLTKLKCIYCPTSTSKLRRTKNKQSLRNFTRMQRRLEFLPNSRIQKFWNLLSHENYHVHQTAYRNIIGSSPVDFNFYLNKSMYIKPTLSFFYKFQINTGQTKISLKFQKKKRSLQFWNFEPLPGPKLWTWSQARQSPKTRCVAAHFFYI